MGLCEAAALPGDRAAGPKGSLEGGLATRVSVSLAMASISALLMGNPDEDSRRSKRPGLR